MKNLNPNSGLRQVCTGKIYIPRRVILEHVRNKTLTVNDLGYFIIALISADWNEGDYRYGLVRHDIRKLAKVWNIPESTLGGNLQKLINKGVLTKKLDTFQVNDFKYFEKAHAYKNESLSDEDLKEIFGNSLLENGFPLLNPEIPLLNPEIPLHDLSKVPKVLNVSLKVVINKVNKPELTIRTTADYTKIYDEGGYTTLLPEDMRWLDEHITADGRTMLS